MYVFTGMVQATEKASCILYVLQMEYSLDYLLSYYCVVQRTKAGRKALECQSQRLGSRHRAIAILK